MEYMLRSFRKVYTLRDKQRTGVVTTANRKELYAIEAQKYIIQESIHIHEGFFCANPHGAAKEEERVLEEFKKQLLGFKRIIVAPQRGYSLPKVVVSIPSFLLLLSHSPNTSFSTPASRTARKTISSCVSY